MRGAYERWQEVLGGEFFGAGQAFRSAVLYVDDEVARELAKDNDLNTALPHAVAGELNWDLPDRPLLDRIKSACFAWESGGSSGPPPSLPLLALSVLAATRMTSSDGMLKSNFYGRWFQLFGEEPGTYRANRLRSAFEDVAAMWEQLDRWLDGTGGLCGTSTVSTDEHYWKIGYPISQALVRGSDREILTRFFAATRLRPNNPGQVSGRELLRRLRVWTAGRDRRLSPRLMDELANAGDSGDTLIVSLLKRLADEWDGRLHEPEHEHRRRALGLRLVVADRGKRLEWLAESVAELPETEVRLLPDGRTFKLHQDYANTYSGLETLHPSAQQLSNGVRLGGSDLVIEWTPQDVVLLRKHPHLGDWVSTEYFEPGNQHWLLAADSAVSEVRDMVGTLGGRTIRETPSPVPGWKLFKGVRAVNGAAFTRTLDQGGKHTHVLEPQIRQHAKLAGGLRIAPEYRAGAGVVGHYLRHAAPDLLLPPGETPDRKVDVVLDGRTESLRTDPRIPFPLWVIPLEEGEHTVGTALSSQTFTVHDGLHEGLPPQTGTLGYPCDGSARGEPLETGDSQTAIRGAYAPESIRLPRTVILRCTVLEAMLITPDGDVRKIAQTPPPAWMTSRLPEGARGPCLEVQVPAGYVWLIYRTPSRWSVRPLLEAAHIPAPSPSQSDFAWTYAVLSAAQRSQLPAWQDYVAAAEAIVGKRNNR
ncbi:hypothetical protein [Streptomyces fungicidicus]|uniref:hypothetical protein n=1 Tax=Streptomyces fungicidicus TaxID=68203 RepID=UPI003D715D5D